MVGMIAGWLVGAALAQGAWSDSFRAERARRLPLEGNRSVLAVGNPSIQAAASLCREINDLQAPCSVKVLPRRARRDSDQWLASIAPEGVVYVVRSVPRSANVTVTVFTSSTEGADDFYVASPWARARLDSETDALQAEVVGLRERVTKMERAPPVTTELEAAALAELDRAVSHLNTLDLPGAVASLEWLEKEAPGTAAQRGSATIQRAVAQLGRADRTWVPARWALGKAPARLLGTVLWVFWEPWCEHSQVEIERLEALAPRWAAAGVPMLGAAGLAARTDVEEIGIVARERGWTQPVALGAGEVALHYGIEATPSAVLLHRGMVVWHGPAAHVDDALLDAYRGRFGP